MKLLQQLLPGGETTAQQAQGNSIPVCIHHLLQLVIENKLGVPVQRRNFSDSTALLDPAVRKAQSCSQGVHPTRDRWAWQAPTLVLSWFLPSGLSSPTIRSLRTKFRTHAVVQLPPERMNMEDSSLCSLKQLQPKQVQQDGSCLSFLLLSEWEQWTKTVQNQVFQTEGAAGPRSCAVRNHEQLSLGEHQAWTNTDRRAEKSKAACQETRKAAAQRQNSVQGEASLHALAGSYRLSAFTWCCLTSFR